MRSLREKKSWVKDFETANTLCEDLEVIYEFYKEDEAPMENVEARFSKAIEAIEKLEFKNMLSEEGDSLSAVLQITAGAGGPFVKTLLTTGVMNGLHSVDVSLIVAPVIHEFIKASMTTYGIEVRDDIEDPEEKLKERERKRLSLAIELAVADAKGEEGDAGLDLLKTLQGTLEEETDEVPQEEMEDEMEVSEMAETQGLMARGA